MDSKLKLYSHQVAAINELSSGSILNGGVGSGKTLTSLSYYMKDHADKRLIVITTAKKRDSGDWEEEAELVKIKELTVDSWNNITKYVDVYNAFFIFDEQRLVGSGAWVKSFFKIADKNDWILLSATPGDTWMDYMPVFVANNFYRNKTDFINQHVEYDRYVRFPKIKKFHNIPKLEAQREALLVDMIMERHTTRHRKHMSVEYDKHAYDDVVKNRWNPYTDSPIENVSEFTQVLRKIVNLSNDRRSKAAFFMRVVPKLIVFYNYTYELDMLRLICDTGHLTYSEWNGQKHEPIPETDSWVYLVQYTAGAEGWNCIETDTILFFSMNYSWRIVEQCEGRTDRLNTPFTDLEYIFLRSNAPIDMAILKANTTKKKFNERKWVGKLWAS